MAKAPPSAQRTRIQPHFPALVDYTNDVIYGEIWERPGLSKRDRHLTTVADSVATHRPRRCRPPEGRAGGQRPGRPGAGLIQLVAVAGPVNQLAEHGAEALGRVGIESNGGIVRIA